MLGTLKLFLGSLIIVIFAFLLYFIPATEAKRAGKNNLGPSPSPTPIVASVPQIRGINYNPVKNNALETNPVVIEADILKIAEVGATHVGLYNCAKFDWGEYLNAQNGEDFCRQIYPLAEKYKLKLLVGYFSNQTQDWTNIETQNRATTQFKELVVTTENLAVVDSYLIGNELFEKLENDNQRAAFAKWVEKMIQWTNVEAPDKPVIYADNSILSGRYYLKTYTPSLELYAINDYEWNDAATLAGRVNYVRSQFPNIKVVLHEWGSDSFDTAAFSEDQTKQADRIYYLAEEIKKARILLGDSFLGGYLFSFNDDLTKLGNPTIQDKDLGASWVCQTCFDNRANEEFWGIFNKPAYEALKNSWKN